MKRPYSRGPGYRRMEKRLGRKGMEALRQDTVQLQLAMRETLSGERVVERDRRTYSDYPAPTRRHK